MLLWKTTVSKLSILIWYQRNRISKKQRLYKVKFYSSPQRMLRIAKDAETFPCVHCAVSASSAVKVFLSRSDQARSKRSKFITLVHAATKSFTNFSPESAHA